MPTVLSDGTVIPSHCQVADTSDSTSAPSGFFGDVAIHLGEVVGVEYPEGESELIYLVNVKHRTMSGPLGSTIYYCRLSSSFESLADYSRATLRPPERKKSGELIGAGAKVLIACANGNIRDSFIIGSAKQSVRPDRKRKKEGKVNRQYEAEFNGVHMLIDDDGSFSFNVNGATTYTGGPDPERDANNKGTTVKVQKNGVLTISDERGATKNSDGTVTYNKDDPGEIITIDPVNKNIDVKSGNYSQSTPGNWTVNVKGNVILSGEGDVTIGNKAKNIYIGTSKAKENLVLGKELVKALNKLLKILLKPPLGDIAVPGKPVLMNPGMVSELTKWMSQHLVGNPAKILAKNKFTEK